MKLHKWSDLRKQKFTPEQLAKTDRRVQQEILRLNLRALRELLGKTQVQLAKATKMNQSDLSKAENRTDHLVSTLRRYVEALGGHLEILATFGDKQVKLRGV
jgi:hypothetical protein